VGRLAGLLSSDRYPTGERAALKRYAPGQTLPLALYRLWLLHLGDELPSERRLLAWGLLAWGLAYSGPAAHRPDRGLGRALAEARYMDARLERLLSAPDDLTRGRLFASTVRFLSAKGEGFDWVQAARLLLTQDPEKRELINRRIAADYYRHLPTE
jgi:CRISPR system Cascade subunit CasB